ncbi:MAG: toxin-antitoxin system YwqK family antitoxin, partial [Verrucomicrobia bacterium]|nr:toxin-antitoxin system YwqK family antitoxin [Verrucomicrobiota bacterium]
ACLFLLTLIPPHCGAQSEVGLIINAILQGLQAADAIRQSADRANQFPTPPNQPPGDPIWDYDEASLVPSQVLRTGPYRNLQGEMVLSARKTQPGTIELLFYRPDGSVSRRELCKSDRRDGRRIDLDEKSHKTAEGPIRSGLPEGDWQFYSPNGNLKAETRMTAGHMTGPQVLFGEDGKTHASNTLLDGKREGPSTLFHPNGSVSDNLSYSADQLNGPATGWWPDGQPLYSASWKNGQLDGPSIENFPSGQKKSETLYVLGKKEGPSREWDDKNNLLIEENYRNNLREGPSFTYSPTGIKLSETLYQNGKKNSWAGTWSAEGAKLSEGEWQNDQLEGTLREYYPNGKLRAKATYLHGKKEGPYQSFNPDASLASSATFHEDSLIGPITLHYPNGKPFAECHYNGDHLSGGNLFYPTGEVLGQFGPVLGSPTNKISSLLLQYSDGRPLSSTQHDSFYGKTTWQGWHADGSPIGTFDNKGTEDHPVRTDLQLWREQQASLEQTIGLTFPPEFNLLPR